MTNVEQFNENAVDMLKEKGLKKYTEVWTSDDYQIGLALRLHYRLEDVNPELKLYGTYLECKSIKMGGSVFVPTDFIADYSADDNKITLSVKKSTVQHETWDRTPDFIAHKTNKVENLQGEQGEFDALQI